MKVVALTALITASAASAFVQTSSTARSIVALNERPGMMEPEMPYIDPNDPNTPEKEMSIALPFLERPKLLDGTLPGDVGFDPLNLSGENKESLIQMREAEIKHGRLAMLAVIGIPAAELWDRSLANAIGLPSLLTEKNLSPSLLGGGLGEVNPKFWGMLVCGSGVIELENIKMKLDVKKEKYEPGDCNFDPLKLLPEDKEERKNMYTKELKHGRIAMVAVLGYVVQETLYQSPIVAQTPFFFHPLFS